MNSTWISTIYADLIKKGVKTIDDVPKNLLKEVEKLLKDKE